MSRVTPEMVEDIARRMEAQGADTGPGLYLIVNGDCFSNEVARDNFSLMCEQRGWALRETAYAPPNHVIATRPVSEPLWDKQPLWAQL